MAINASAGARAVATGRGWIASSATMRKVLAYARDIGVVVVAHAEDGGLTDGTVATEGETATRHGLPAAPAIAEALAVARDLMLAEETRRAHPFPPGHYRRRLRPDPRRQAPRRPRHLRHHACASAALGHRDRATSAPSPGSRPRCATKATVRRRWRRSRTARSTCIASGHDPRGPEAKRLPFVDAEPGMSGAETLLALSLGLVRDGLIPIERLFALLAANPAKILGLKTGTLEPGAPADLIVLDPGAPWQIEAERMVARAGNTPFDRLPVQGKVLSLFKGGTLIDRRRDPQTKKAGASAPALP